MNPTTTALLCAIAARHAAEIGVVKALVAANTDATVIARALDRVAYHLADDLSHVLAAASTTEETHR